MTHRGCGSTFHYSAADGLLCIGFRMTRPRPVQALWHWLIHKACLDLAQRDLELMANSFPRR